MSRSSRISECNAGSPRAYNVHVSQRGNARVVYSSAAGKICRNCGLPGRGCRCGQAAAEAVPDRPVAKLRMERAGRGGKTVTVVFGLPNNRAFLEELAQKPQRAARPW